MKTAGFQDPLLLVTTDGVGTKLKIAIEANRHDGIGIDLVAMCVNDLVVQGGHPLAFLDYYATGILDIKFGEKIVSSIAEGCKIAGCALLGGETAEMPGLYKEDDYDLAGFALGAVERNHLITGKNVKSGDLVIGLNSNGLHANGFSLVRQLISDNDLDYVHSAPFDDSVSLGAALLAPTKIYVRSCLAAIKSNNIKALVHITGGGFLENLPRVLPVGLGIKLDATSWSLPPIFGWLQKIGNIEPTELIRTFNCGIGMVAIVAPPELEPALNTFTKNGEIAQQIGEVVDVEENGAEIITFTKHLNF